MEHLPPLLLQDKLLKQMRTDNSREEENVNRTVLGLVEMGLVEVHTLPTSRNYQYLWYCPVELLRITETSI